MYYKILKKLKLLTCIFSQEREKIKKIFLGLTQQEKKDLVKFLKQEQIVGYFYHKLKLLSLQDYFSDDAEIKNIIKVSTFYNIFYLNYMKQLSKWAEGEGVKLVFFKGVSLLCQYYSSIEERSMGDIDILIDKKNFKQLRQKLEEDGFEISYGKYQEKFLKKYSDSFEFWKMKGDFCYSVDCHFNVLPFVSLRFATNVKIKDVFERTKEIEFEGVKINVLSVEDCIVFISLHTWLRHTENVKLKNWIDLFQILSKEKIDFKKLFFIAKEMKLILPVYFTLKHLEYLFNFKISGSDSKIVERVKKEKRVVIYVINILIFLSSRNISFMPGKLEKYFSMIFRKLIHFLMVEEKGKFLISYFFPEFEFLKLRYPKYKNYGFLLYFIRFLSIFGLYN